ncbi:MAG: gliding motility-associated C-terminal domain-containing protein [Chitinophagales bacterium]
MKKYILEALSFFLFIKNKAKKIHPLWDFTKAATFLIFFNTLPISAQFQLNGNTTSLGGDCYRLTDTFNWELSSLFSTNQIDLNQSFEIQTEMLFGVKDGADGMTFLLQSQGNTALGLGGGGIGYETITPSVIVEFDTYQNNSAGEGLNNDPVQDHVAVLTNGSPIHTGTNYTTVGNIEDLTYHDVRIIWNAASTNLLVYLDCVEVINYTNDIVTNIFGGSGNVYWGFTASTGGQNNRHEVCIISTNFFDPLEDQIICDGETIAIGLDDIPTYTYSWTPTTGLDNAAISNPMASPTTTTNYILNITDDCGNVRTDDVTVTVTPKPVITLSNQAILCPSESFVTLDATIAGGSYVWSTNAVTPSINATSVGVYTVTVSDAGGCTNTQAVTVTMPDISMDLGLNQTLCQNETITLDATPTGTDVAAPTYLWSDSSTDPTLVVSTQGTYTVNVTNGSCVLTDAITILYNPLPNFDLGANLTLCPSETATLNATPTGGTAPTYLWQDASTNATFTVTTAGTYTVTVTDLGCSKTDQITVTYNQLPNVDLGGDQTFCIGNVETLSAVPSNAVAPTYEWQDGSTNPTFDVSVAGTYAVTVTDQGCVSTDQVEITFNANPGLNFGPDFTVCGTSTVVLNPLSADSFVWQDGSTNPSYTVEFPGGTYSVTVTVNGCQASDEINIDYAPIPPIDLGPDVTICQDQSYTINAPFSDSYEWQDGSTNSTFTATQTGLYTVEITIGDCSNTDDIMVNVTPLPNVNLGPDVTLCEGETLTLAAPAGASYQWQDGSVNSTFTVTQAGTYSVIATANGCSNSDEITVNYTSLPVLDLGADITLCEGETTTLTAPIADTYQWQNGATIISTTSSIEVSEAGIYSLMITSNNCSSSDQIEVVYNTLPSIDLGEDVTLCEGQTTTLAAPTADSYEWQDGSTNPTFQVSQAGIYSVTITTNNCSSSDQIEAFYNLLPDISLGENLTLCEGESTTLDATPDNSADLGTITYEWQDGSTNPTFAVGESGTFSVTVTSNGCQSTDNVTINFDTLPSIDLGEDQTLCEGETLILNATLVGGIYEWQDGSTNPTFEVSEAGTYSVVVTLNSCILEGSIIIDYQALPIFDLGADQTICEGETLTLDATTANATYEWQDGSTNPTFEVSETGDFEVMVTANGCTSTDIVSISVTPLPIFNLGADITLCEGQTTTLDATPDNAASFNNITYEWQDGSTNPTFESTQSGTYTVIVTADNCVSSDEIVVTVDAAGIIDLGTDLTLCEGETFTLDATTPNATYEWQDGSTNPTFEVIQAGSYSVTVNTDGCLLLGSIDVTYSPQPAIDLGVNQTLCEGETLTLNATIPNATYEWQDGSTNPTFEVTQSGTYSVIVSVNNCLVSDDIEVIVNPLPIIDLGADVTVCEGETTTLTAPIADSYLWNNNMTTRSIVVNQAGIYSVTATTNNCSSSDEIEVFVNPAPAVNLGGDVTLCEGENFTLDATFAGATYEWQDGSTNPTFNVSEAGTYSVIVSVGDCSSSDEIVINFDNAGTVNLGADATLCEGETLQLNATTPNATYEWQDGSTNPTFNVNQAGTYSVTVTIAGGCILLGSIDVAYSPQPTVDLGADLVFCEGESRILDATIGGATYEWQDGSTNPTFEVTASGVYEVVVSVGNCSASDGVTANVTSLPIVDLGADLELCEGDTATLTAANADTYLWNNNETTSSIEVAQSGIYTVTASTDGCSSSDEIAVVFNALPVVNLGADLNICSGETVTLDATFEGATYEWQDGSTNPTFEVTLAGTYSVIVTTNGCSSSDEVVINFDDAGTVDLGADATLCEGETLVLDATTANAAYEWQDGSVNPTFEVTASGIYSVTVSIGACELVGSIEVDYVPQPSVDLGADLAFCEGETTTLDATFAGATYEWQDGSINPTFEVTASGIYAVTVTVGNCVATDELTAMASAVPTVDLGEDVSLCGVENFPLVAPIADAYIWSTGDTNGSIDVLQSGIYTVTVTNGICSNTDEISVSLDALPTVDLGGTILLCGGLAVVLDATQTAANTTYEWQDGSTNPTFELNTSGTYSVTVTVGDCSVSDSVEVTLEENPTIDLGMDTVLCTGQTLLLTAPLADSYLWQDGSTNAAFEVTEAGTYSVETQSEDCLLTGSIDVTYAVVPTVDLGADIAICEGESVVLEGIVSDVFSFQWLEIGATTPTLEVTESGIYTLQVFSENPACAVASDNVEVRVEVCEEDPGFQMVVPTAFSPNGDGNNDQFSIFSNMPLLSVETRIYNRWGKLVFTSMDANEAWDGSVDGEIQPIGVYVYYVLAEYDEDGFTKQILRKGNVSLVR